MPSQPASKTLDRLEVRPYRSRRAAFVLQLSDEPIHLVSADVSDHMKICGFDDGKYFRLRIIDVMVTMG